jgi:hypothetical protein
MDDASQYLIDFSDILQYYVILSDSVNDSLRKITFLSVDIL